ncbi:MAG TPA: hypothetical protein VNL77_11490 [Roseiflexaceae bacterium]|nr:hypothetical protein [Roseiflexaceae bacterium]
MTEKQSHPGEQHPEEWRRDLNPEPRAGQNVGHPSERTDQRARNAYELKAMHRQIPGFSDDELRRIPLVPEGERLQQGATYVDFQDPALREFTARGDMVADPGHFYIPKSEVDYQLWNRLIGVDHPERTGEADEG